MKVRIESVYNMHNFIAFVQQKKVNFVKDSGKKSSDYSLYNVLMIKFDIAVNTLIK